MKRIAVVEDEVYMREELCNMLQKDGYLAEAITELEDAARLLAALRPDLVILDLNLPEISGFQICQELKNKTAIPGKALLKNIRQIIFFTPMPLSSTERTSAISECIIEIVSMGLSLLYFMALLTICPNIN